MSAAENFRRNLRHRLRSGAKPATVARKASLARCHIYRIIRGTSVPSLDTAEAISRALGATLEEMLQTPAH